MQSNKVLFLSTYPPRECGIATFTKDLSDAINFKFGASAKPKIIAMEENPSTFRVYNKKVFQTISEKQIEAYERVAKKINSMKNSPIVNIQHEFGIFGGDYGAHLLRFMEKLEKSSVTTFHTVLENPDPGMKHVVQEIARLSSAVVVMTNVSREILANDYEIANEKIVVISHGVPNINLNSEKSKLKKKFGLENSRVLVTFGMLSRGKAIEHTIKAMPLVLEKHPDVVYLIVGETHPKVREEEGESYRQELVELAKSLGVENSVKFLNKYLSLNEIIECLSIADVYLAPSLDPRQICSGTVSYAMSAGKAIVSSRNKYNEEVLSNGRGIMLSQNDYMLFASNIISLLDNESLRLEYERKSFEYSRSMIWSNVASKYFATFSDIAGLEANFSRLPRINFNHFHLLTDDFGMMQFSDYSVPQKESGYTLDDNARALGVAVKAYEKFGYKKFLSAADTYLSFIESAQTNDGYFHNVADGNRVFVDDRGSEDSFGRAIHSLGNVVVSDLPAEYKLRAKNVLESTLKTDYEVSSPRAQADFLIGLIHANEVIDSGLEIVHKLLDSLVAKFDHHTDENWNWFEEYLTYGNSIIPEALFEAKHIAPKSEINDVAVHSIDFLTKTHFIDGKLVPIGQDGWYEKNGERSLYDQQPIEAAGLTTAYLKAFDATGNNEYLDNAKKSFEWFLGGNSINQMVYDDSTGGCFDGITKTGVNLNQGAESTICYLNARLSLERYSHF